MTSSIVVASPSLLALREAYPNAEIIFVTFKANKEILNILGLTDRNIFIDNSSLKNFTKTTAQAATSAPAPATVARENELPVAAIAAAPT